MAASGKGRKRNHEFARQTRVSRATLDVVVSPIQPELLIRLHGAEQEISWPHPSSGFVLERSRGLVGTWEVVTRVPLRSGAAWRVRDDAAFAEKAFYQLRKIE